MDFYLPTEETAIQVCYNLYDEQTLHREATALVKLGQSMGLKRLLIVTRDSEDTLHYDNCTIEVVPVWQWLIEIE